MKHTLKKVSTLAATLITFGSLAGGANAALTITNWNFTPTSLSFNIFGTIDGPVPSSGARWIFLVDEGGDTNWSTAPTDFFDATINSNISINGGAGINNFWIETFDDPSEDRLTMNRPSGWNIGDTLSGTLNVSWELGGSLSATPNLEFRWGRNGNAYAGTLQGIGAVPEPSSALLVGLGALGLVTSRRRIK